MIYNRDQSEVTVLGEVQKYKVGIDERNINHIVTILSSNLYSYPMISFLRETVSNAVDSHIEAGVDEPIIITITKNDISIRDFGTGISPERFNEIYLNIGSSTKRESNDYIGSFGIGRFSCLSVADIANITSFYNGKAYYYVMNKDIDQLHIDLLYEKETDEKNGVEVKVPIKSFDSESLDCLSFIDNVYVDDEGNDYKIDYFNKRKIYSYKNFKVVDYFFRPSSSKTQILLGKIPYVVDYSSLWDYTDIWHKSWKDTFTKVFPCIEIGKIDITPNRESLLYSERTKTELRRAFDACIDELKELWFTQCNKEYEDIKEYMYRLTSYCDNELILNGIKVEVSDELPYNAIYKKYREWDKIESKEKKQLIQSLFNKEIDVLCKISGDTMHQGKRQQRWFTVKKLFKEWIDWEDRIVIAVPSKSGFSSQYFKAFVNEKYGESDKLFIRQLPQHLSVSYVKHLIRSIYGITMLTDSDNLKFVVQLFKEVLAYLKKNVVVIDIIGNPEYEKYKKDHCQSKNYTKKFTGDIPFTITVTTHTSIDKYTCKLDQIIKYVRESLRCRKHRIVYADLDNPFIPALREMAYPNLVILSAAKGNMKYLKEGLPEWVKPIEDIYSSDNRTLQRFATMKYIMSIPGIDSHFEKRLVFPELVREKIIKLQKYRACCFYSKSTYSGVDANPIIDIVPPEKYDRNILSLFHDAKKYLQLAYKLDYKSGSYNSTDYYILMKAKKLRLDFNYYRMVRQDINKLLEIV